MPARTQRKSTAPVWLIVLIGGLILATSGAGVLALVLSMNPPAEQPVVEDVAQQDDYQGITAIVPPRPMPDFTLVNQAGEETALRSFRGKPTLIFFGFTNCPDICPLSLQEYSRIHEQLDEAADEVNFVFISVDGGRDTPERIASYFEARRVSDFVTGLTGTEAEVRRLGVDYGLKFVYSEADDSGRYSVDHTPNMFLLDDDNRWIRRYDFGTAPEIIVEDLLWVLGYTATEPS